MAAKTTTPTTATNAKVSTFVPSGKAKATASPVAPVSQTIPCPGTNFVCNGGKYATGSGTHFACGGTGQFDTVRIYTVTAKEQKLDLFPEWHEYAKTAGTFRFRLSNGKRA